jgi:hypothetical protein
MARTLRSQDFLTRLVCAFALVCLAFAHKPLALPVSAAPTQAELAAFLLPDGTFPDLCLVVGHDEEHGPDHGAWSGCDACRITAAFALVAPPVLAGAPVAVGTPPYLPLEAPARVARAFPPSAPPRAPPLAPVV